MKNKIIIILLSVFFTLACTSKESFKQENGVVMFTEDDLPKAINLTGTKLNLSDLLQPKNVMVKEGKILVSETSNDFQLHIYDANTLKKVSSKAKNGFGPGELTNIWKFEDKGEPGKIWAYNLAQISHHRFDIHDSSEFPEEEFKRIESFFYVAEMAWASDTTVWARMRDGEVLNFELGVPNGDTLAAWGSWQDYADRPYVPSSIFSNLNQGKMSVNLHKRIGVIAGILRSYIDILDLNSGKKIQIIGPDLDYPKYTVEYSQGYPMPSIEENKEYYLKNFPGKNAIFLLYAGFSYNLFGNPPRNPRIFLMDYEGKIFKVYELDHVITSMHIDEESKKIYGITVDAEPNVVVFDYSIN